MDDDQKSNVETNTESSRTPNLIHNFIDNLDFLQEEWHKLEMKYEKLQKENHNLSLLLKLEKSKYSNCQKQVQFIRENQKSFEKLRQIYLTTKCGSDTGSSSTCVEEKSSQTTKNVIEFKKAEIDNALNMVGHIKLLVQKHGITSAMNQLKLNERETNYERLEKENVMLKTYLRAKQLEMDALKTDEKLIEQCVNENKLLRRVVQIFDRHTRMAERTFRPIKYPEFKDDEKELIKYVKRPQDIVISSRIPRDVDQQSSDKSNKDLVFASSENVLQFIKKKSKPTTQDNTYDLLKKLRVFQPEYASNDPCKTSTKLSGKIKKYHPCDKLRDAFITKVLSSTSCKNRGKLDF